MGEQGPQDRGPGEGRGGASRQEAARTARVRVPVRRAGSTVKMVQAKPCRQTAGGRSRGGRWEQLRSRRRRGFCCCGNGRQRKESQAQRSHLERVQTEEGRGLRAGGGWRTMLQTESQGGASSLEHLTSQPRRQLWERGGRGLPMESSSSVHGPQKLSEEASLPLFQDRRRHSPEQEHPRVRQRPDQEELRQEQVEGKSRGAGPRECDPHVQGALQLERFSCLKVTVTRV